MVLDSSDFRGSSVRRMSWAALLGTQRLLASRSISDTSIRALLDHLWRNSTDEFTHWYEARPELVGVAMGDPMPEALAQVFSAAGIRPEDGRELLESLTEIIYTNLFAAITWEWVDREFDRVVRVLEEYGHAVPDPEYLPPSDRSEWSGWGEPIDTATLERIRRTEWSPT